MLHPCNLLILSLVVCASQSPSPTLPLPFSGFPGGSAGKESTCNAGHLGSIPGLGRSPGEGKGYPLQYFGLENSMDCIIHGVTKSRTRLSDFHFQDATILRTGLKEMGISEWVI